jgi:outer membrane receptor protein involved in Fe transport
MLWYNDDKFEFRVAANYLGKQYVGQASYWPIDPLTGDSTKGLVGGLDQWTDSSLFVDLSSTYHISDTMNVTLNVQNLTEEGKYQYLRWSSFRSYYEAYERRTTLGLNVKF